MIRFAASLYGGLLLLTMSPLAQAAVSQRAGAAVFKDVIHTADAVGELTGLLSSDYVAPADRVKLASEPVSEQMSSKEC